MKRIEDLLKEVKIRFGENWEDAEIDEGNYPFDGISFFIGESRPVITPYEVWGNNGLLYQEEEINGKERWATAKLTQKPEKWVVEKDENHPMWARFLNHYDLTDYNDRYYWMDEYSLINKAQEIIELRHQDVQYLTLDQWAEFFLPKVDFSIHNEEEWFYVKTVPPGDWSWLTKGPLTGLGSISLNLISKSFYKESGSFVNSLNEIIEFRRPTDEEMNVLYETHPEYAPPKEGDYGLFWNHNTPFKWIGCFDRMNKDESKYLDDSSRLWNHFKPFSPELQEMIKKEIDNI